MKIFDIEIDLAGRLKVLRKREEMTQEQVADAIGIPRSRYGSYEDGRAEPKLETLYLLTKYYRFKSLEAFLGIGDPKVPTKSDLLLSYQKAPKEIKAIVDFALKMK